MEKSLIVIGTLFLIGFTKCQQPLATEQTTGSTSSDLLTRRAEERDENLIELNAHNFAHIVNVSDNIVLHLFGEEEAVNLDSFEAPYDIRKNYPYYLSGYDDDGRPIFVAEIGKWNLRKIVEEGGETLKIFDRYVAQAAHIAVKTLGDRATPENPVKDAILIADMDQLNLIQLAHVPSVTYLLHLARQYQSLVEKHIHIGIVLNTNAVAHTVLNLVKPVFGRIFEKIEIYGTNSARFIPHILQHCPKNQVAPWYGGTKDFTPVKIYG